MHKLTSDNTPIRIDFLPSTIVKLPGRIGMTIAPGKKIHGIHGNWDRDLERDLVRIRTIHGANVLVCLLEPHELVLLNIPELPNMARRLGLTVVQFPIPDVSVPDSIDRLRDLVGEIMGAAVGGKTVAIHCRGGLGRSGLVAACCLVACGVDDEGAMAIVRATRRGTIETPKQEQIVREFRRRSLNDDGWAPPSGGNARVRPDAPAFSRFLGCLIGGAVGDALGYPVEFISSAATILDRYGRTPPDRLDFAQPGKALVSDDTQMTLFVAEGVIRGVHRHSDRGLASMSVVIGRALLRWYDTQTHAGDGIPSAEGASWRDGWLRTDTRLYARRAPGNTCMSSLQQQAKGMAPSNNSKGCGAVMRSAPIGLAAGDRERAFQVACESGSRTHGHPLGYLPAGYLASVVFDVARGMPLANAMREADALLRNARGDEAQQRGATDLLACMERVRDAAQHTGESLRAAEVESFGAGWTGEEALAISLYCALSVRRADPSSIARALWSAVAHAGDSDSTGAITGNILGAMFGIEALPPAWVERVELRDTIERVAGDLYTVAILGVMLDHDAYPPG